MKFLRLCILLIYLFQISRLTLRARGIARDWALRSWNHPSTCLIYAGIWTRFCRQPSAILIQAVSGFLHPDIGVCATMQLNVLNFSAGESQMQKPQPSPNKMDQQSLEPDWTKATWTHIAWVATGCTLVLLSLTRSAIMAAKTDMWLEPLLAALLGYVLADLVSGIFHWSVDNYGDINTPIFGGIIDSFQGHHDAPWSITERDVANNLHELGRGATTGLLIAHLLSNDATVHAFVSVFGVCVLFCQQFHAWSHTPKKALPKLVLALQDMGVLISRKDHALHHQQPFNCNYCIVSGIWNQFLDEYKVCEGMEMVVFYLTGVRPRSWMEPKRVD